MLARVSEGICYRCCKGDSGEPKTDGRMSRYIQLAVPPMCIPTTFVFIADSRGGFTY